MSFDFYKLVHFLGLIMVFSGLGAQFVLAINGTGSKDGPGRRWVAMLHGIGLVLLLVAGFGMLAKGQLPIQGWVISKLAIWILLGGIGAIAARRKSMAGVMWIVALLLGLSAAYLARFKPF